MRSRPICPMWNFRRSVAKFPDEVSKMFSRQYVDTFFNIGIPRVSCRNNSNIIEKANGCKKKGFREKERRTVIDSIEIWRNALSKMAYNELCIWEATDISLIRAPSLMFWEYSLTRRRRWRISWNNIMVLISEKIVRFPRKTHPRTCPDKVAENCWAGPMRNLAWEYWKFKISGTSVRGCRYNGTFRSESVCQNISYSGWS